MRTVYAVRVSGPRAELRPRAQTLVLGWLEAHYPYDERSAGTSVRVVDEAAWFRVVVDQHLDAHMTSQIVVSLRSDARGLSVEARQAVIPRTVRVGRRSTPRPLPALVKLVGRLVDLVGAVDAGTPVATSARLVSSEIDAAGVAALCDAPSRTLPVLIEAPTAPGDRVFGADQLAGLLSGIAHVVVLADERARRAFNDAWGIELLRPTTLTVVWPDKGDVQVVEGTGLTQNGTQRHLRDRVSEIIAVAAASLPVLPRPRPERRAVDDEVRPSDPATEPTAQPVEQARVSTPDGPSASAEDMVTLAELLGALDELEQAWNRVDDLQGAVAAADAMVAAANARTALLEGQIDALVRAKVDLEIRQGRRPGTLSATSAADAVAQARLLCRHLAFAGDYRDVGDLTAVDPTALLVDLVKLDSVAVQWMTGDITATTFALACRNVGLDFASDISDTARQEYAQDYAITWQSETVLAVAHLRRGKGVHLYRIHLYLDRERRRVVVGHIGRHLRGKRS